MKAKPELIAKYRALQGSATGQNNPVYAAMIESMDERVFPAIDMQQERHPDRGAAHGARGSLQPIAARS
jgi:hypothetical protein